MIMMAEMNTVKLQNGGFLNWVRIYAGGRLRQEIQSVPSGKYKQTGGTNPSFCREQIHKFLASGYFCC